jgi:hypothetical protein
MNFRNVNQIVDGILNASMTTYVFSFLAVAALFGLGLAVSVWRTPKKEDSQNEALKWPTPAPKRNVSKEVKKVVGPSP